MPPGRISRLELEADNFHEGAGGQWYRDHNYGNRDVGDNHTHLIGVMRTFGYDPVTNPRPPEILVVDRIEFKIRLAGRNVCRVWLIKTTEGDFLMPVLPRGINTEEARIARRLFDALPSSLSAE
ncbi:hypothetical protein AiwAL_09030 [Acidiphilium sp. AL]|uniref:Uncharacterized protein n=1 Tax=Acidiphilium iwatense TaxID=768198 RepID=A0ABS9DV25_9PROT|nr:MULTISPECIES: hypothetical protein [Acidiphilium]MCF3946567.1 hypothetical protein [Acidiphilium iwatense]MCU4160252.1 hypothetical protein [Acidiphilium sp. AL]